jgi:hypothetical protein
MRTFSCDSCGGTLFFENDTCLACGQQVGFRPDELAMCTVAKAAAGAFRQCRNWTEYSACNWFAPDTGGDELDYCAACMLNEVVPDLSEPHRRELWIDTERAKRRLIFTLLELRLPLLGFGDKLPLRFQLLADERVDTGAVDPPAQKCVYTGHDNGLLTINIVEADDSHREAMRKRLNERYRTMLGHLRHEVGHYYWYLLVEGTSLLERFRALFGDEREDYDEAMRKHYESPPNEAWQQSFVSAYASMHPWEDFAETWAHYIHIVDTLETANASALALGGRALASPLPATASPFAAVLDDWLPLTVTLNQLNRSMGMHDAYPFALTCAVIEKLTFVHDICGQRVAFEPTHGERVAVLPADGAGSRGAGGQSPKAVRHERQHGNQLVGRNDRDVPRAYDRRVPS